MKTGSTPRRAATVDALRRLRDEHGGGVAVAFGIALTVMIGFGAAATEIGTWLLTRRAMQGATDAAAVSALNATTHGGPDITTQARGIAAQNGWTHGVSGITVTVNQPPSVGNFTGNAQAVEVIVAQTQAKFFSGLLPGVTAPTIKARSVAAPNPAPGTGCLLGLSNTTSVTGNGSAGLTLNGCDITGNGDIALNGSASITARSKDIGGTVSLNGSSRVTLSNGPGTQNDPIPFTDPYAGQRFFTRPSAGCTTYSLNGSSSGSLVPGTAYCSVTVNGSAQLTLPSGIYYIEGGCFCVNGSASVTSQSPGVTIVLTGATATSTTAGSFSINGSGSVTLTALSSQLNPQNNTAGLVFFQDPAATGSQTDTLNGSGTVRITGAIDVPNATLNLNGSASLASTTCLNIIAWTINLNGSGTLSNNCPASTGVLPIGHGGTIRLVE